MKMFIQKKSVCSSTRSIEFRLSKTTWVLFGFSPKQISLGFSLNRYQLNVDLLFFWISVEF